MDGQNKKSEDVKIEESKGAWALSEQDFFSCNNAEFLTQFGLVSSDFCCLIGLCFSQSSRLGFGVSSGGFLAHSNCSIQLVAGQTK